MKQVKLKTLLTRLYPLIFSVFFIPLFALNASAQNDITGKVTNDSKEALQSATVTNKTSKRSVTAGANGEFTIAAKAGDVLEVSAIGYIAQEITVKTGEPIIFVLRAGDSKLDEVVVVGYTTQRKGDITGSVATVTATQLNQRVATSPTSLLQGKLPGLQTTQGSGDPGILSNYHYYKQTATY